MVWLRRKLVKAVTIVISVPFNTISANYCISLPILPSATRYSRMTQYTEQFSYTKKIILIRSFILSFVHSVFLSEQKFSIQFHLKFFFKFQVVIVWKFSVGDIVKLYSSSETPDKSSYILKVLQSTWMWVNRFPLQC